MWTLEVLDGGDRPVGIAEHPVFTPSLGPFKQGHSQDPAFQPGDPFKSNQQKTPTVDPGLPVAGCTYLCEFSHGNLGRRANTKYRRRGREGPLHPNVDVAGDERPEATSPVDGVARSTTLPLKTRAAQRSAFGDRLSRIATWTSKRHRHRPFYSVHLAAGTSIRPSNPSEPQRPWQRGL